MAKPVLWKERKMRNKILVTLALLLASSPVVAKNRQLFLGTANTIVFRGPVNGESANTAMRKLNELNKKRGSDNYALFLVLDTPGGDIEEGENFIQYAKTIRNLHTVTMFAASMGSAIVEALPGHRFITENGVLMFHRAKLGMAGQVNDGEFESRLAFYKQEITKLEQRNADRMSMPLADYKARVKDEMWLGAAQSVKENAADSIMDIRCSQELIEQNDVITIQIMMFSLNLKFSGCPAFRTPDIELNSPEQKEMYSKYRADIEEKFSPGVLQYVQGL